MLTIVLLVLAVAVIALLIFAARQPDEFSVVRSAEFSAPAESLFPHVNNLRKWDAWSPWAKLDPAAKNSFEGPEEGVGAQMSWSGNHKVGVGSMTVLESNPFTSIRFRLEFLKPMQATNLAEFSFKEDNGHTQVTWRMSGTNNFVGKIMSVVMNCDKMVGGQFEQGLASLRQIVESGGK